MSLNFPTNYFFEFVKTPQVAGPSATEIAPVSVAMSTMTRGSKDEA